MASKVHTAFFFGAFNDWLSQKLHSGTLESSLTDADWNAGRSAYETRPDSVKDFSAIEKLEKAGYLSAFFNAQAKSMTLLCATYFCFQRLIDENEITLRPGQRLAAEFIVRNYKEGRLPSGLLPPPGKTPHKLHSLDDVFQTGVDEAVGTFIVPFASILSVRSEKVNGKITEREFDLIYDKLLHYLNAVAHMPNFRSLELVHQIDFLDEGIELKIKNDVIGGIQFSGQVSEEASQQLDNIAVLKDFRASAKTLSFSTGCPAVHVATTAANNLNLMQTSQKLFVRFLRNEIFSPAGTTSIFDQAPS